MKRKKSGVGEGRPLSTHTSTTVRCPKDTIGCHPMGDGVEDEPRFANGRSERSQRGKWEEERGD